MTTTSQASGGRGGERAKLVARSPAQHHMTRARRGQRRALAKKVSRGALQLSIAAGASSIIVGILPQLGYLTGIPYPELVLHIPATVLGIFAWLRLPHLRRVAPLNACALLFLIGIVWVVPVERKRAVLLFASAVISIPIGALILDTDGFARSARTFLWFTIAALAASLIITAQHGEFSDLLNVGVTLDSHRDRLTNRNGFGSQLAFAAVLALALYVGARPFSSQMRAVKSSGSKYLFLAAGLSFAVILTQSRGQTLALFIGASSLIVTSTKVSVQRRFGFVFGLGVIVISSTLLLESFVHVSPWRIIDRYQDATVSDMGGRTEIWHAAYQAMMSTERQLALGSGTAGADQLLGKNTPSGKRGEDGVLRRSTHNTIIEWLLCYGILGIAPALWLALWAFRRARYLDRVFGSGSLRSLIVMTFVSGQALVFYRTPAWPAAGALLWAALAQRPRPRRRVSASRQPLQRRT